ncbi:putative transcriptional regulator [Spiroplasma clarkii]|uniref:Type III pantothenate kinase n=1 Tax=Spiroplasma clarkii TaxID=2139 RepID=A0A1Y0KZE3_9MOLU|nr:type III pantothenate kinase [Spiroplasma clarkii]ARU91124.1 putative transcriptional regulator [Spiroplasma clarkii]ATX70569.1 type III pantothenate kinase [Spiroplasma clarkii]
MKILMIDVGNTTADFRVWDSQTKTITKLTRPLTNSVATDSPKQIVQLLKDQEIVINKILYVSVVPVWNDLIRELAVLLKVEVFNVRNLVDLESEIFAIDNSAKIGADFICNYFAARKMYNLENGVIVSMGTATTFLVVQDACIVGTIIAPGLTTALNGLISNAALLQNFHYEKSDKIIGKNTVDAINLGAYNAHLWMTTAVINNLRKNFKIGQVIYTGGNSLVFETEIANGLGKFNEQLIFEGIVAIAKNITN